MPPELVWSLKVRGQHTRVLKSAAFTEGHLFVLLPALIACCSVTKGAGSLCWLLPAGDGWQPAV